ncbi:hypothetical protein Tco_1094409 [Tanacetum coccineum]|uniref:Synaptobrevin, longin-like domain protein n=1 Tax=Tanacetum coccineum TaxID=301880 RepID=A0ABQ5IGR8_9ASTR
MEITATIDGKVKIVTEGSIRRHLKLEYSDGISNLPTTEIFEQLALTGYVSNFDKLTFQKGHFSPQWRILIHTILHCLSPKKTSWEQFSSNIANAIICLATNRKFNFSKLIFDGMVKNLDSKHKFLMYPRFIQIFLNKHKRLLQPHTRTYTASTHTLRLFSNMKRVSKGYIGEDIPFFPTMIVQGLVVQGEGSTHPPKSPTQTPVADKAASTGVDVRLGGATTTVTSLDAGHDSGNIDKTSTMPHDSPLPRVNTLGRDEGSMQLQELMALCTKLSNKVESLEIDLKQTKQIYGTDFTKLIKKVKKLEKTVKTSQARRKVQGRHEHDMESDFEFTAAEEVCSTEKGVSTAELVSTVGASVSTASASPAKDKGKAIIEEAETIQIKTKLQQEQERLGYEAALRLQEQLDKEERQRITKVHEAASSFNIEEWEDIQARIKADEELALTSRRKRKIL